MLALLALIPSCRTGVPEVVPPPPAMLIPAVPVVTETIVGHASVIATDNAFLVFQLEPGASAEIGEELAIRFAGADVGKIKVTPPVQKRFVTADILQGTAEKGYEIVRTSGGPTPAP